MNGFRTPTLCLLCVIALSTGCATVTPPRVAPADPVTVYVTDYGIHSSLILPVDGNGLFVEYSFGDFGYAALNRDGPLDAIGALLWSVGSGFGRQYLRASPGDEVPTLVYQPKAVRKLSAGRADVDGLLADLGARYDAGRGQTVHNELTKIDWRKDGQRYGLFNNCNQLTARQLKRLRYDVHGPVIFSAFSIRGGEPVAATATKEPGKQPGGLSGSR